MKILLKSVKLYKHHTVQVKCFFKKLIGAT